MDDTSRIETFKQWLRIKFANNANGLRGYIADLGDGAASDEVAITSTSDESGQSTGQLVLEPLAKLQAAMAVLAELDPDNTPTPPAAATFADLSQGCLET